MLYNPNNTPEENLETLAGVKYPGRLLAVGKTTTGLAAQVYIVEGRSEGSRNRVLIEEDNIVSTKPFDVKKPVGNPKLTIYDAMRRTGTTHVVSNGDQTTTAIQFLRSGKTFQAAMNRRQFEPDKPNYTSRISAFTELKPIEGSPSFGISVVRKLHVTGGPLRNYYEGGYTGLETPANGVGYAVQTYSGDGKPLPSFNERPFTLPLGEGAEDTAQMIWERLDPENRVAIAAKTISATGIVDISIINQREQEKRAA